ncbi:MAG: Uncharacterised protein [Cryomorphaceae bacterium]|nr:MAG: Uncharacterised protein [Cryomorphaceae bacterium]
MFGHLNFPFNGEIFGPFGGIAEDESIIVFKIAQELAILINEMAVTVGYYSIFIGLHALYVKREHICITIIVAFRNPQVFPLGPLGSLGPLGERTARVFSIEQRGHPRVFCCPFFKDRAAIVWTAIVHQ